MNNKDWNNRELEEIYVSTFIMKGNVYKRETGRPKKQTIYMFLGINFNGYKKFIDIVIPKEETTSYWYNEINGLKNRGVKYFFMVAMLENSHMKKGFKMVYPDVIYTPSFIEIYNNSKPYILQKNHRKLVCEMQSIYTSNDVEEAKIKYEILKEKYANEKLLLLIVEKYIDQILNMIKYSKEARMITSYTESYIKIRNRLNKELKTDNVYENDDEIKEFISSILKEEEEKFYPCRRNWSKIVNEMDSKLTDKIMNLV